MWSPVEELVGMLQIAEYYFFDIENGSRKSLLLLVFVVLMRTFLRKPDQRQIRPPALEPNQHAATTRVATRDLPINEKMARLIDLLPP